MTLRAALATVGLTALLGSATAHAAATQSLDSVRAAAEQAVQDRYSRPGSRVVVRDGKGGGGGRRGGNGGGGGGRRGGEQQKS